MITKFMKARENLGVGDWDKASLILRSNYQRIKTATISVTGTRTWKIRPNDVPITLNQSLLGKPSKDRDTHKNGTA